eukprot:1159712-Pelagomonas_calceolata.AAC.1
MGGTRRTNSSLVLTLTVSPTSARTTSLHDADGDVAKGHIFTGFTRSGVSGDGECYQLSLGILLHLRLGRIAMPNL